MIPDNARILRITAAAGTELADAYSQSTVIKLRVVRTGTGGGIPPSRSTHSLRRALGTHFLCRRTIRRHRRIHVSDGARGRRGGVPGWKTVLDIGRYHGGRPDLHRTVEEELHREGDLSSPGAQRSKATRQKLSHARRRSDRLGHGSTEPGRAMENLAGAPYGRSRSGRTSKIGRASCRERV